MGCTCYMNSLLQQFHNISIIREGILATPDNHLQPKEESYLFQIKKIFAFLKKTDKKFHNPKDFTSIFKNYDGQVMNVTEQMDVDEFYNLLIDRLEPYLKNTKYETLFKFIFSGTLSNEIIGKNDCKHYSETNEVFQSIILQVKNKKNIEESLDAFISGEMMEGENSYNCERCDKKVSALKRQCFKKLPNVLVLVLKRFDFDYDTMQKSKINDYCEFPLELNMRNYCQEFLNENLEKDNADNNTDNEDIYNYMYDLNGVIIHTGTSERGHYYSLVKKGDKNWYEFNDINVTNFDIDDLADEAFGGSQYYYNNKTGKNELIEKSTNAYVLFYTKKNSIKSEEDNKIKMDLEISNNNKVNNTYTNNNKILKNINNEFLLFNNLLKNSENENKNENSSIANIQKDILDNIKTDNFQYWVSKSIFSNDYINFINDILINYNSLYSNIYNFSLLGKTQYSHLENMNLNYKNFNINFSGREIIEKIYEESNNNNINIKYNYTINQINFGFSNKIENYNYDKIRIHRFKKSINSLMENIYNNVNNKNYNRDILDMNYISEGNIQNEKDIEIYLKKISKIYKENSKINKDLIISNKNFNKNTKSLNSKLEIDLDLNSNEMLIDNNVNLLSNQIQNQNQNQQIKFSSFFEIKSHMKNENLCNEIFKFCAIFFFTTAIRLKEKTKVLNFVEILKLNININIQNAIWLLEEFSNFEIIIEFLLDAPIIEMRRLTAGILYNCLLKICKENEKEFKEIYKKRKKAETFDGLFNDNLNTCENFISALLYLLTKKSKYPNKDFNNIYFILWRFAGIGFIQKDYLYNCGFIKFVISTIRLKYKLKCDINPEESLSAFLRPPLHKELVNKNPIVSEKLSFIEEIMEKKQMEKNGSGSDSFLLLGLFEVLSETDYVEKSYLYNYNNNDNIDVNSNPDNIINNNATENSTSSVDKMQIDNDENNSDNSIHVNKIQLSKEIVNLLNIENSENLRLFAIDSIRSRLGSVYLQNLINKFCFNNEKFSDKIFEAFYENFSNLDSDEILQLLRVFRGFITLNDDLAETRVNK